MKKLSLLFAMIVFVCANAFAQSINYDFNDGTAGAKIAQTYGSPWTTWSNAPGGSEDGVFGEIGGSMAAHFTYGNDQVIELGDMTAGAFTLSFDMYVPTGKDAYNNVLHIFNGSGSQWATEVYYNHSSNGTAISAGGVTTNFTIPFDTWFNVKYVIDLDNDLATFFVEGAEVVTWQFSLQADGTNGARQLGAMDFFPPTSAAVSDYYVDNLEMISSTEDEVIVDDPFTEYTVGNKIASESQAAGHDWWTTWSNAPGGSEDGVVAEQAGSKCGHFTYGNDQVLLLGDATTGTYNISFDMYVPTGKDAYNNLLHIFNGSGSQWATEVYFNHSSNGTSISIDGNSINFTFPFDAWFEVAYAVDLDNDLATFTVAGTEVASWQFSTQASGGAGERKLAAIDFFPPTSAAVSDYYVDNVYVVKLAGVSAPNINVTPDEIAETLEADDMTTVDITIANTGNSIGEWNGYIDFGNGGSGSQTSTLAYHDGTEYSGIGSSGGPYTREMAVRLPATAYAGSAMGMKIKSVMFQVGSTYKSADNTYIFRIYGQGANNQPGVKLAEKTVTSSELGVWLTATFDETVYLDGQVMWATVQLEQAAGEYPLTMDGGEYGQEADGNWLSTQGGSFDHCYSAGSFGGAWLITVNCEGQLIPGNWAALSSYNGSIASSSNQTVILTLNSIGLDLGEYNAHLIINTNDEAHPQFNIPVTLDVGGVNVAETEEENFQIYPNPASSQVTVKGENLSSLAIYNVAGQLVRIVRLDSIVNTIDMNVEAGVYFFSIYDNNGNNSVQRVVITK